MRTPGADQQVPDWFARAIAQAPEHRDVVVAGARVAYRAWGPAGAPGVVLVHGGAAHSGWWDHVAPLLTGHRVVALDLTGHGDSDRRAVESTRPASMRSANPSACRRNVPSRSR